MHMYQNKPKHMPKNWSTNPTRYSIFSVFVKLLVMLD